MRRGMRGPPQGTGETICNVGRICVFFGCKLGKFMQLLHLPYILYPFYTTCQEKNKKNQKKTEEKTQKNHRNILRMHFLLDRFDIRCIIGSIPPTRGLTYYPRIGKPSRVTLNTRLAVYQFTPQKYTNSTGIAYRLYTHPPVSLQYPLINIYIYQQFTRTLFR